jgi:very-short-patch-repair endonuclease
VVIILIFKRKSKREEKEPSAEKVLWMELKSKALDDHKRQQHLIDNLLLILFVCQKLVVEGW